MKKTFYYNFEQVGATSFPKAITEIDYFKSDSMLTKTTFGSFVFNNEADLSMLNFEIPADARLVE